jgi:ABC-type multidrug transport system ATPase subunit
MDEADILSDRIAIIAEGSLTAIGSGMFLKRHFADSYLLTLVAFDADHCERMTKAVTSVVPEAKFMGTRGRELSYSLPVGARHCYAALFERLQDASERKALGIDTYGLSAATMEEVFLQASSVHEIGLQGKVRNADASQKNTDDPLKAVKHEQLESKNTVSTGVSEEQSTNSGDGTVHRSESKGSSSEANSASHEEKTASIAAERDDNSSQSSASLEEKNAAVPTELDQSGVAQIPHKSGVPTTPQAAGPATPRLDNAPAVPTLSSPDAQISTIEEAPKVVENEFFSVTPRKDQECTTNDASWETAPPLLDSRKLLSQQFGALFRKRALSVRRDRRAWASQLCLPSVFVLIALVSAKILSTKTSEPALKLSTDMFIGTQSAGGVSAEMSEHMIPFGDVRQDAWGADIQNAFDAVKGSSDTVRAVSVASNHTGEGSPMGCYLMAHNKDMLLSTYGAVSTGGMTASPNVTMWFKTRAYHSVPVMTHLFNNARFQLLGYGDTKTTAWSHPLPKSQTLLEEEMTSNNQVFVDLLVAVTILLALGFIPASFVVYLVHEKSSSGKHQQLLTGVGPNMYWVASYFFDIVNYLVPCIVCFLIFVIFQVDAYSGRNSFAILVLLFTYGVCMTPCMYCLETLFKVPSTAYVTLICLNIFTGISSTLTTTVLDMAEKEDADLKHVNRFCKTVFPILFPNFCLGRGMIEIATNHYMNFAYDEFGVCIHSDGSCIKSALGWSAAGKYIFHLILMAPIWFALRLLIEQGFCTRKLRQQAKTATQGEIAWGRSDDEAVNEEADRVKAKTAAGCGEKGKEMDSLLISELSKSFPRGGSCCRRNRMGTTHAVRGVSVGVPRGECFGLLGVNGAGKTTTMRMITGDTSIDGGDVRVCDWSVHGTRDRARRHLGYCPQFDALPDKLTARETLALYARIRGVPAKSVQGTVDHMIKRMCLESHERTICEHLSGGNKRKLSTALALIGQPDVVLLDEPSTGVDVGARRFLWDVIDGIRQSGHALVLTSHSMEECEVLCTRLTVMVHGQFRCLGSPMQLKAKYGGGYTLTVKIQQLDDAGARLKNYIASHVPGAALAEESVGLFRYNIQHGRGNEDIPLGTIFATFEGATKQGGELDGCISDYTLSQTSLEEVFLHFCQEATLKAPEPNPSATTPAINDVEKGGNAPAASVRNIDARDADVNLGKASDANLGKSSRVVDADLADNADQNAPNVVWDSSEFRAPDDAPESEQQGSVADDSRMVL